MWFTLLCFCSMSRNNLEMGSGQTFMLLKHFICRLRQHWPAMGCWSCSSVSPCACGATWSRRSVQVWGRQQVGITRCHLVVICFLMDRRQHDEIVSHFQHSKQKTVTSGMDATEPEGTSPTQSSFRSVGGPTVRQPRVWKCKLYRLQGCKHLWQRDVEVCEVWLCLNYIVAKQWGGAMKCSSAKIPRFSWISQNTGSSWVTWLTLRLLLFICSPLDRSHMRVRIRSEWAYV